MSADPPATEPQLLANSNLPVDFALLCGPNAPQLISSARPEFGELYSYPRHSVTSASQGAGHQVHTGTTAVYRRSDRPTWVRAGMITSLTGSAAGRDGRSGSLACPGDRQVFTMLREQAEVIVVGAGTARDEDYGPSETPLAIVTSTADVPHKLKDCSNLLIVCPEGSTAHQLAAVHAYWTALAVPACTPEQICLALGDRGLHNVILEGGPALLADWLAAGYVDELCFTLSPQVTSPVAPLVAPADQASGVDQDVQLIHLLQHKSGLFGRWLLSPNYTH